MKSMKLLLSAAVLPLFVPVASSAGLFDDLLEPLDPILNPGNGTVAPIPEPSGALIMGAALVAVVAVQRLRRR